MFGTKTARPNSNLQTWTPYLVGLLALLFTVLAWARIRASTADNDLLRAESAAQQAVDLMNDRIRTTIGLLRAGAGLFAATDEVTRHDFKAFVDRLNLQTNYPGTLGIGFAKRVPPDGLQPTIESMRQEGFPAFHIWPESPPGVERTTIVYLEPLDRRNLAALGYDMTSDPTRLAAMEAARDNGEVTASHKVELVQERVDQTHQAGFLIYVPVYAGGVVPPDVPQRREKLVGYVYSPLRADDMLRGIFENQPAPLIDLRVFDGPRPADDITGLLHDSRRFRDANDRHNLPTVELTQSMPVAGQMWTIVCTTRPLFDQTSEQALQWYVLGAGIMVSLLLLGVSMSQRSAEMSAAATADELRKSEARLRESEQRFRAIFSQAAAGMMQIDIDGRFLSVNQRMCEITGYSDDELLKLTFRDITHPDDRPVEEQLVSRVLAGEIDGYHLEKRYIRKDGRAVWVRISRSVVREPDGRVRYAIGVVEDITEHRRAQEELLQHREHLESLVADRSAALETSHQRLRQSERLAAIGTLSTGLGHDMGNLLLPIRLRLAAMQGKGLDPQFAEDLEAIRKSSEYLQELANGLRMLALDPDDDRASDEVFDLSQWWAETVPLLRNALPRNVELVADIPDSPDVRLRLARHRLTQALFNLVQNAGDALRSTGKTEGRVSVSVRRSAEPGMVEMRVSDDGPGMTAEVRSRCLEPFFTTKTRAISTGLGLALVHGIVQKAGGRIEIESQPGRGATFILTLPAAAQQRAIVRAANAPRIVASVSLYDARRQAYLVTLLGSLGFEVRSGNRGDQTADNGALDLPLDNASLWVLDADHANNGESLQRARRFVSGNAARRAIVFADLPADAAPLENTGIIVIPPDAKPTAIWQAARDMARDLSLQTT